MNNKGKVLPNIFAILVIMLVLVASTNSIAGSITATGMFHGDLYTFLGNVVTMANANRTLTNDILAKVQGDYLLTTPVLAAGSNADDVANLAFDFVINGMGYKKAAITTGTAPGTDRIPPANYGAVAFQIGADGTVDAVSATGNATGFSLEAEAIAALPAVAADHARMGYVTVIKSDGAFTFGTTALSAANVTEVFYLGSTVFSAIGSTNSTTALKLTDL